MTPEVFMSEMTYQLNPPHPQRTAPVATGATARLISELRAIGISNTRLGSSGSPHEVSPNGGTGDSNEVVEVPSAIHRSNTI